MACVWLLIIELEHISLYLATYNEKGLWLFVFVCKCGSQTSGIKMKRNNLNTDLKSTQICGKYFSFVRKIVFISNSKYVLHLHCNCNYYKWHLPFSLLNVHHLFTVNKICSADWIHSFNLSQLQKHVWVGRRLGTFIRNYACPIYLRCYIKEKYF